MNKPRLQLTPIAVGGKKSRMQWSRNDMSSGQRKRGWAVEKLGEHEQPREKPRLTFSLSLNALFILIKIRHFKVNLSSFE